MTVEGKVKDAEALGYNALKYCLICRIVSYGALLATCALYLVDGAPIPILGNDPITAEKMFDMTRVHTHSASSISNYCAMNVV